jgi:hypothetical protein
VWNRSYTKSRRAITRVLFAQQSWILPLGAMVRNGVVLDIVGYFASLRAFRAWVCFYKSCEDGKLYAPEKYIEIVRGSFRPV